MTKPMRTVRRPRRYVSPAVFAVLRPVFRHSRSRNAYVLRAVGSRLGPVLRVDRRHGSKRPYVGLERRGEHAGRARVA
jgi:hypothetical protein